MVLWEKEVQYLKSGMFARVYLVGISNIAEIPLFSGNKIILQKFLRKLQKSFSLQKLQSKLERYECQLLLS